MKVHGMEWKLVSQMQTHHNHPCHPEEKNITSSLKERGWVECLQIACLLRPTHHGEGEKARGEPRIKNILITFKYNFITTASKKLFCLGVCILLTPGNHPTIITLHVCLQHSSLSLLGRKPRWNLMSPPKLPTHTPITNIIQPMEPRLFMVGGNNLQLSITHYIRSAFGHTIAVDIPLGCDHGLKDVSRTGAQAQTHFVGFFANVKALFLERLLDGNTGIVSHHTFELGSVVIDRSIKREDSDEFKVVAFAAFVIVGIVGGSDLHSTGTERHVDKLCIADDGDSASVEGMHHKLSMKVLVPGIFGMNGHGPISQHGLQTSRRHNQLLVRIFNRIRERSQHAKLIPSLGIDRTPLMSLDLQKRPSLQLLVIHFNFRNGRLQRTAPIPQPLGAVQQSILMKSIECLNDRLAAHVIHGKSLPAPIDRAAETTELGRDAIAIFGLPLPDFFDKFFTAEVVAG
mmetsp:Transcript_23058/g.41371  ORF Transcript_23058/g.41371 Transcript_23058/m.41371 type:complete len:458 (-) Transcript_23058:25-1398(-)